MIPYFYTIKEDLFDDSFKNSLITESMSTLDQFVGYASILTREPDGNNFKHIRNNTIITEFVKTINLDCFAVMIMHKPNTVLRKHVDDPNRRNCVLSIPLYPKKEYPATLFYQRDDKFHDRPSKDSKVVATCHFHNMKPTFLNTTQVHNLTTKDSVRLNLQFCFNEKFENVVELYKTNNFFKNDMYF